MQWPSEAGNICGVICQKTWIIQYVITVTAFGHITGRNIILKNLQREGVTLV
jgi:hypothetical protein